MCVFIYVHKILLKSLSAEVAHRQIFFHPQHNAFGLPAGMVRLCSYQPAFFCHFKGSISTRLPWKHAHAEEKRRGREMGEGGRKRISYFVIRTCLNERLQWRWKLTKMSIDLECFIRLDVVIRLERPLRCWLWNCSLKMIFAI